MYKVKLSLSCLMVFLLNFNLDQMLCCKVQMVIFIFLRVIVVIIVCLKKFIYWLMNGEDQRLMYNQMKVLMLFLLVKIKNYMYFQVVNIRFISFCQKIKALSFLISFMQKVIYILLLKILDWKVQYQFMWIGNICIFLVNLMKMVYSYIW